MSTSVKTDPAEISEAEFEAASRAGEARQARGQAVAVRYFSTGRRLSIELSTGAVLILPVDKLQGLADASDDDLRDVMIGPRGLSLHFETLDVDLGVAELLDGVFGTRKWMAQVLGRTGGQAKTERKAEAARENGKRGGRPRRDKNEVIVERAVDEVVRALGATVVKQGRSSALEVEVVRGRDHTLREGEIKPHRYRAVRIKQADT